MVLNEPETSLHPDLLRPLASLIRVAAGVTQVVVVTHSRAMLEFLTTTTADDVGNIELYKDFGETKMVGQRLLDTPAWDWGKR